MTDRRGRQPFRGIPEGPWWSQQRVGAASWQYPLVKRLIDVGISLTAAVAAAPIALVVAASIRIVLGPPVFFVQKRAGFRESVFGLYKFRTMNVATDEDVHPLPDAERITSLGRFLRALSVDELPTLINVLKGDMSLVGPRPLLTRYIERYSREQRRRLLVPPGITGWAQVNGRNALNWDEKFAHDIWYVDHCSMWLDLKILAKTLLVVIRREGIAHEGEATMPEFLGKDEQ